MSKQCICCLVDKDVSDFSKQPTNADGYDKTCKQCRADMQKARLALKGQEAKGVIVGPSDWPQEVIDYTKHMQALQKKGGKLPRFALELIDIYTRSLSLAPQAAALAYVTPEAFLLVKTDVDELKSLVADITKKLNNKSTESRERQRAVARIQRIDKLNRQLLSDPVPLDIMGDEEYQVFLQGVTSVIATVKVGAGLPDPMSILSIVGQLSDFEIQCPSALETLYLEFFKPYIAEHIDDSNYEELASKFPENMNLYKTDWLEVLNS